MVLLSLFKVSCTPTMLLTLISSSHLEEVEVEMVHDPTE